MNDFEKRFENAYNNALNNLDISKCKNVADTEGLINLFFDYQKSMMHDVLQELLQ